MKPFLSGNALKLLAALFMTIDHVGVLLLPHVIVLRILGRLALPIFAFMIAEGCRYTRNRLRYFGSVFALGVLCQIVYYLAERSLYFSILITFSLSIATIYALQDWKEQKTPRSALVFFGAVAGVYALNRVFAIDYGFWGCMLPVFAAAFQKTAWDRPWVNLGMLGLGLLILAADLGQIQYYALPALPLLACYNGRRGRWKLKYFFYLFYPIHLVLLQGIALLLG